MKMIPYLDADRSIITHARINNDDVLFEIDFEFH